MESARFSGEDSAEDRIFFHFTLRSHLSCLNFPFRARACTCSSRGICYIKSKLTKPSLFYRGSRAYLLVIDSRMWLQWVCSWRLEAMVAASSSLLRWGKSYRHISKRAYFRVQAILYLWLIIFYLISCVCSFGRTRVVSGSVRNFHSFWFHNVTLWWKRSLKCRSEVFSRRWTLGDFFVESLPVRNLTSKILASVNRRLANWICCLDDYINEIIISSRDLGRI